MPSSRGVQSSVRSPVADAVERSAELDGDARGVYADVEITCSVPACPHPQVAVERLMQFAEERVREDVGKVKPSVDDRVEDVAP